MLTSDFAGVSRHHGNPAEHPNGEHLVFQAQESDSTDCIESDNPGKGLHNELWLLDNLDDEDGPYTFHRLTDGTLGVLHPEFSHDGTMLFWAENHGTLGLDWRLAVAPFLTGEQACGTGVHFCLGTICRFEPTGTNGQWYESHGFGPDDDWVYFSCSRGPTITGTLAWDICRSEVPQSCTAPEATPLTLTNGDNPELSSWDEHAKLSPLEDAMVWITSYPRPLTGPPDGQSKEQLTFFNYLETRFEDYDVIRRLDDGDSGNNIAADNVVASDSAWHPDGTRIGVASVITTASTPCQKAADDHIWILDLTHGEGPALGWREPTANAADSGGDGDGWEVTPQGAQNHGTDWAVNANGVQDRHRWYDYGFSVPSGAVIDGIEVRVDWKSDSTAWGPKLQVDLSWNGGGSWTSQKTTSTGQNAFQVDILGGAADTWGRTWTYTDFTNGNFRVRVRASCSNESLCNGRNYHLDWLPVRVTYH